MAVDALNVLAGGLVPSGSAFDVYEATAPEKSGPLARTQPLGLTRGIVSGMPGYARTRLISWKNDAYTANTFSITNPTSTDPEFIRIATPAANGQGGQIFESDGTTANAKTRYFPRSGNFINFEARFRYDNADQAIWLGVTNYNAALATAATGVPNLANLTDGIIFYKAAASATLELRAYRGGVLKKTITLSTAMVAATWYEVGFIFDTNWIVGFFNGVKDGFGYNWAAAEVPNAALGAMALNIETAGGAARNLDIQRINAFQEAI